MERIAIFSDVHANLTALEATLQDIKKRGLTRSICLGDIVLKGVSPDIAIDKIRESCEVIIQGNCDEYISSPYSLEKRHWSRIKIGEERAKFIRDLPVCYEFYMSGYLIRLFHASPFGLSYMYNPMYNNQDSTYANRKIENPESLFENASFIGKNENDKIPDIVGYGHTHTPSIVRLKNKMIFNPGSVGMPAEMLNDSNENETSKFSTLASYIILEGEYGSTELCTFSLQLVRVPYSLETEIERVKKSDMPGKEKLIRKLQTAEP